MRPEIHRSIRRCRSCLQLVQNFSQTLVHVVMLVTTNKMIGTMHWSDPCGGYARFSNGHSNVRAAHTVKLLFDILPCPERRCVLHQRMHTQNGATRLSNSRSNARARPYREAPATAVAPKDGAVRSSNSRSNVRARSYREAPLRRFAMSTERRCVLQQRMHTQDGAIRLSNSRSNVRARPW